MLAGIVMRISILLFVPLVSLLPSHAATISAMAGPNTILQPGGVSYFLAAPVGGVSARAGVQYGGASAEVDANCGFTSNYCGTTAEASFSDAITIFGMDGVLQASVLLNNVIVDGGTSSYFVFGSFSGALLNYQYVPPGCCSSQPFQQSFTAGIGTAFSGRIEAFGEDRNPIDPMTEQSLP